MTLSTLIDKQDGFEVVRDKLAQILADESAAQMVLATAAGKDPELWRMDVYLERANPWEKWLNEPETANAAPIINVWFDTDGSSQSEGSVVDCQPAVGTFNIDCYGFAISKDDGASGHIPGDEMAAKEAHRAIRLVRNILMSSLYTYLDLRPLVSRRWASSRTAFQPQQDSRSVQRIVATRLALSVKYLEQAPQYEAVIAECLHVDIKRASDGRVLAEAEYGEGCVVVPDCDCTPTHFDDNFWRDLFTPEGGFFADFEWDTFGDPYWAHGGSLDESGLEAIGGWNIVGFEPDEMRLCVRSTFANSDPGYPLTVIATVYEDSGGTLGSVNIVFTGDNTIQTVAIPLDWGNTDGNFITDITFIPDFYAKAPDILCIEFAGGD